MAADRWSGIARPRSARYCGPPATRKSPVPGDWLAAVNMSSFALALAPLLDAERAIEDRRRAQAGQESSAEQPGLGRFEFRLAEHALLAQLGQII